MTGLAEQYDHGRDIHVQQEGSHVLLSVEAGTDSRVGVALLTPAQARTISTGLLEVAESAEKFGSVGDDD